MSQEVFLTYPDSTDDSDPIHPGPTENGEVLTKSSQISEITPWHLTGKPWDCSKWGDDPKEGLGEEPGQLRESMKRRRGSATAT